MLKKCSSDIFERFQVNSSKAILHAVFSNVGGVENDTN